MKVEEIAGIIEAEAGVLSYAGKLAVAQCIYDNDCNTALFVSPSDTYSDESLRAATAVFENGDRRFPNARLLRFRSFTNYSDGNGNPDWEKIYGGSSPIPADMEYLGYDCISPEWGHFYFGYSTESDKEENGMANFKMAVICGHGDGDSGAVGNGYKEADLTRELGTLIVDTANANGGNCDLLDTSRNWYMYLGSNTYDFTPYNLVLEVHFNSSTNKGAADGKMTGSMCYVHDSVTDYTVENKILAGLYAIGSVQAWDGVVKATRQYSGGLRVQNRVTEQGVRHVLLETCFVSDGDDMAWYQANKTEIASRIVAGIVESYDLESSAAESSAIASWEVLKLYTVNSPDGSLNLRSIPSLDSDVILAVPNGMIVLVTTQSADGWSMCRFPYNGEVLTGYLRHHAGQTDYMVELHDDVLPIREALTELNIRTAPDIDSDIIVTMETGYRFSVLQTCTDNWGLCRCGQTLGYVGLSDKYSRLV